MPLIIITGYPTSGKTHRAKQLANYFRTRTSSSTTPSKTPLQTHHLTDSTLSIPRSVYDLSSHSSHERSNNSSEKDARALVYATVKRLLSQNDVVILDAAAGNYIKGWRYQLYCEAKAVRTPCCVVHVGTPVERARDVNEERLRRRDACDGKGEGEVEAGDEDRSVGEEAAYERETWENLVFRYEEPNGMTRWDSPLFTVVWDDAEPPCEAIWAAVVGDEEGKKVVVRPNAATVAPVVVAGGFLARLDRATVEVVGRIGEWQRDHEGEEGGEVEIEVGGGEGGEKMVVTLELPARRVGMPELQRLRRGFIQANRTNAVGVERIKESFVAWLNDSFEK